MAGVHDEKEPEILAELEAIDDDRVHERILKEREDRQLFAYMERVRL